jgi:hypothetical protein
MLVQDIQDAVGKPPEKKKAGHKQEWQQVGPATGVGEQGGWFFSHLSLVIGH